ncbi:hypothetical protein HPB47_007000 [Ixodes persulcatus]|uniref:Uncharacterized protein n=1 Tax=Ixodes persulcatus TaxID=34615 RepID=A0AC60P9A5_IXOPE|nr:hypothetical protein HPB47_007000 [Ixodes persulcatus]
MCTRRSARVPRQPQLPTEDLKVILRPLGGFDAAQLRTVTVREGVLRAAGISYEEACSDQAEHAHDEHAQQGVHPEIQQSHQHLDKHKGLRGGGIHNGTRRYQQGSHSWHT